VADTAKKQSKIKNIALFLLAVLVLFVLWLFINDSTYNLIKGYFVKNSDKYTEMYAYAKSRPGSSEKYFVVQGNEEAKSFFRNEAAIISEDSLGNIKCSGSDTYLIYEKPSDAINKLSKEKGGEELSLNKGMDIEFYVIKFKGNADSCNLGGKK